MQNTNKLIDLYNSTFKPALTTGQYDVTLVKHAYVAHETSPYIRFEFKVKNTDRIIVENRFERNFAMLVSHLRQQLGRESEEINPVLFFNELIEKQTPLKLWVVKRKDKNGIMHTNIAFLEPLPETPTETPNTDVIDDIQ